jgi:hypothetical protein
VGTKKVCNNHGIIASKKNTKTQKKLHLKKCTLVKGNRILYCRLLPRRYGHTALVAVALPGYHGPMAAILVIRQPKLTAHG